MAVVEAILTPGPQGGPGQRLRGEARNPGGGLCLFINWKARGINCEKVNVALERKGLFTFPRRPEWDYER